MSNTPASIRGRTSGLICRGAPPRFDVLTDEGPASVAVWQAALAERLQLRFPHSADRASPLRTCLALERACG